MPHYDVRIVSSNVRKVSVLFIPPMPPPLTATRLILNAVAGSGTQAEAASKLGISQAEVSRTLKSVDPALLASTKNSMAMTMHDASSKYLAHSLSKIDTLNGYQTGILACASADKFAKLTEGPAVAVQINVVRDALREYRDSLEDVSEPTE